MPNTRRNCYDILGISRDASREEITAAYKKLALKWHPDRCRTDKENATQKFIEINDAYRYLLRERRRSRRPPNSSHSDSHNTSSSRTSHKTGSTQSFGRPSSSDTAVKSDSRHSACPSRTASVSSDASDWTHVEYPTTSGPTAPECKRSYFGGKPFKSRSKLSKPYPGRSPSTPGTPNVSRPHNLKHRTCFGETCPTNTSRHSPSLSSCGKRSSKEWNYSLKLTLEDLLHGKRCRFRIVRYLLSGKRKTIILDVDVPPGCRRGTRIVCPGAGHERKDGTFQDIIFIIDEESHDMFTRIDDNLVLDVTLPWDESLEKKEGVVQFRGLDSDLHTIRIDYAKERVLKGCHTIPGAGMPTRAYGEVVGRGDLIVHWQIDPPTTKWHEWKNMLHI